MDKYPFVILFAYFVGLIFLRQLLPEPEKLLEILKNLYGTYGYWIVFVGAILEGLFLISLYVPGSVTVLLGAALSKTGILSFPIVLVLAIVGFLIAFVINYQLGKYGWYHVLARFGLENTLIEAEKRLKRHTNKTLFIGYFHPSGASFLSTAAGVLKIPFKQFLLVSVAAQVFWGSVWGSLAYFIGFSLVEFFLKYFGFAVGFFIALWFAKNGLQKKKE